MNSIGIQLRISDLLFAVQKRWKIILLLTLLGLVSGVFLSALSYIQSSEETYQVSGSFMIAATDTQGRYSSNGTAPNRNDIILAGDMYDTVYYVLRSDRLLNQVIDKTQMLGVSVSDIRNNLDISRYYETTIITMKLKWDDTEAGLLLWNSILEGANGLLSEIVDVGSLRIINEPEAGVIGSRSANMKTWMLIPILGFVAGIGYSIIELLMHPTLINVKDVETVFGLETIGMIPYEPAHFIRKGSILVKDDKASAEVLQNYSSAAYILRNRLGGGTGRCQCLYITSTVRREGRTTAAANLAIQLSDMERRTLLIDFDYKSPSLGLLFLNNLDYNRSLNALYRGEINAAEAITTLTGHLDLLPMVMEHNLVTVDGAIIELVSRLKAEYEFIIIDAPPVGTESETLRLNQVADTVLFVMRYDTATIPEIQASLDKLEKSGIHIAGCIINGTKTTRNVLLGEEDQKAGKDTRTGKKTGTGKKKSNNKKNKKAAEEKQEAEMELMVLTGQRKTSLDAKVGVEEDMLLPDDLPPVVVENSEDSVTSEPASEKKPQNKTVSGKRSVFGSAQTKNKKAAEKKKKKETKEKKQPPITGNGKEANNSEDKNKVGEVRKRTSSVDILKALQEENLSSGDPFDDAINSSASKSGNLFEQLMDDADNISRSDDEVTEELLRMGLNGSWEHAGQKNNENEVP